VNSDLEFEKALWEGKYFGCPEIADDEPCTQQASVAFFVAFGGVKHAVVMCPANHMTHVRKEKLPPIESVPDDIGQMWYDLPDA